MKRTALVCAIALAVSSCHSSKESSRPIGPVIELKSPLGLPPIPIPPDNPPTPDAIALGRRLYSDARLSSDNTIACATCHNPQLGFSDGRRVSAGFGGHTGSRNAPTVLNAAFWPMQFWDGRAASLEDQAGGPIANP